MIDFLTNLGKRRGAKRPGSGPSTVHFSRAEVQALAKYAVAYPLEEATAEESEAFKSGIEKIRARANRRKSIEEER